MRVLKFGGTSVADRRQMEVVADIVAAASRETRVVVVASAVAGITNRLVKLIESDPLDCDRCREVEAIERHHLALLDGLDEAIKEPAVRLIHGVAGRLSADLAGAEQLGEAELRDRVLAAGERLSVPTLVAILQSKGCPATPVDGSEVLATDSTYGEARVDLDATRSRCRILFDGNDGVIPVVTGFVGGDAEGRTTTLGRGGSDLSASVLGAALDAECVEIWTDVDGVLTGPPALVPGASRIPRMSYAEAAELSYFGAKVLHPRTVQPLAVRGIPIHVRNTTAASRRGTAIVADVGLLSRVAAVAAVEDVTILEVRAEGESADGLQCRVAPWSIAGAPDEILVGCRASCDGSSLLAVPTARVDGLRARLFENDGVRVDVLGEGSVLAIVGHDIGSQPWVVGRALEALGRRGLEIRALSAGASAHAVTILVDRKDLAAALSAVHNALMLDREPNDIAEPFFPSGARTKAVTVDGGQPCQVRVRPPAA